ncbi:MAG: hypothetical protein ACU88J_07940 [Gammaproteobacteria bacterium]
MNNLTIVKLMQIFPHAGELVWIGVRPTRGEPMITINEIRADQHLGLIHVGDNLTVLPDEACIAY